MHIGGIRPPRQAFERSVSRLDGFAQGRAQKQLLEAQRLWDKYTEASCGFYCDPAGGTSARMLGAECTVTARIERAAELDVNGDLKLIQFS